MCPSLLRHLRASHADCACHAPSAAICLKLRASAIPSGRATGMIHLRGAGLRRCDRWSRLHTRSHWGARRWNAKASRLFAGWLDADGEKNLLRYIFLRPEARTLILDWTSRAHRVVAEFRAAVTGYSDDPDIRRLVDELRIGSSDFGAAGRHRGFWHAKGANVRSIIRPWDCCTISRCRCLSRAGPTID
jgi:hypothetical protein